MGKAISQFFAELGYPFRNIRWSWGARSGASSILLRTWEDEYFFKQRRLIVLDRAEQYRPSEAYGLDERFGHLESLWNEGVAGYTVIATVKDKDARPREILGYRDDAVFALDRLERQSDGVIVAYVGESVRVRDLKEHARTHRTRAGDGLFALDDERRTGISTDSYIEKVSAFREWLIELCIERTTTTYSEVMSKFALSFYPLRSAMSRLGNDCKKAQEPIITALIVDKDTHRCSHGFFDEFGIEDDQAERERCYVYWGSRDEPTVVSHVESIVDAEDFQLRAIRFSQSASRPEQEAFRAAVFEACRGRCVISGCDVPEALEAAHRRGRDWRQGHNHASDGLLLRRDLHNLYDRELLILADSGRVELSKKVLEYYREFEGILASE